MRIRSSVPKVEDVLRVPSADRESVRQQGQVRHLRGLDVDIRIQWSGFLLSCIVLGRRASWRAAAQLRPPGGRKAEHCPLGGRLFVFDEYRAYDVRQRLAQVFVLGARRDEDTFTGLYVTVSHS